MKKLLLVSTAVLALTVAHGQTSTDSIKSKTNKRFDTYLTINASNFCFYKTSNYYFSGSLPKFSYNPSTVFNLSAKIFLSNKYSLIIQGGLLNKRFSSDQMVTQIYTYSRYSYQTHSVYQVNSLTGLLGLQRHFRINDNFSTYIGIGIASKFDTQYREKYESTSIIQSDTTIYSWSQQWTEKTTKGNQGIGLNTNVGFDVKVSKKFTLNTSVGYSFYQYFKNTVQTTKTKKHDLLTNIITETEITSGPNSPNVFWTNGGLSDFGRADLIITIGLTYKIKW